jgi:uncharacterized protein (DUF427 family)
MNPDAEDIGAVLAALTGNRPWWPLVEPSPRWIRVRLGDALVADSRRALLLVQYGPGTLPRSFLPTYFMPTEDVLPGVLIDPTTDSSGTTSWTVAADGRRAPDAAWAHERPPEPLQALVGMVTFAWSDTLSWFEEDEPLVAHARDPHKRVDVVQSSRTVKVSVEGVMLAESRRPLLLFETALPARYYLPPDDVLVKLVRSDTQSVCPYKGVATWWSAHIDGRLVEDIAWSYESPIAENPRIRGLICFRNERVDLTVDGTAMERPITPWS